METTARTCQECGKQIKGRLDKKFCNDYCRNVFNNKLNGEHNNYIRNINNLLRRNRRILATVVPEGKDLVKYPKARLMELGFNQRYHTHQFSNKKGDVYHFCYEYGWLNLEGDFALIVRRNEISTLNVF